MGRKAFPQMNEKELDHLLKGRFFQALNSKWQRKLAAPKASETFNELYDRARTLEKHEKQISATAAIKGSSFDRSKQLQSKHLMPIKLDTETIDLQVLGPSEDKLTTNPLEEDALFVEDHMQQKCALTKEPVPKYLESLPTSLDLHHSLLLQHQSPTLKKN